MLKETAEQIEAAAADWAARLDRNPLTPEDEQHLAQWLAGDSRRVGAYARMRAVSIYSEEAGAILKLAKHSKGALDLGRRRLVAWAGASAASLAGVGLWGWTRLESSGRFFTRKGELRVLPLSDGSVITLNTASEIRVWFTAKSRTILLMAGEALFDVAKDPSRPFRVSAGSTEIRAIGTSFTVRRLTARPVEVLVREGIVDVTQETRHPKTLRVAAGSRMSIAKEGGGMAPVAIPPTEIHRALAWQSGSVEFKGERLDEACEEFARYSDVRIVVDDPALAREEVVGLFQARNPVGFARSVASSLNIHAEIHPNLVRLYR